MDGELPDAIAQYLVANQRLDAHAMAAVFAEDGVVDDSGDGHHPKGRAEIAQWIDKAIIAVDAVFVPDAAREDGGQWILEGPVSGNFPGSPLRFTYWFTLGDAGIEALKIRV